MEKEIDDKIIATGQTIYNIMKVTDKSMTIKKKFSCGRERQTTNSCLILAQAYVDFNFSRCFEFEKIDGLCRW